MIETKTCANGVENNEDYPPAKTLTPWGVFFEGEEFIKLSPVVKGDRVHHLPYKFMKISVEPAEDVRFGYSFVTLNKRNNKASSYDLSYDGRYITAVNEMNIPKDSIPEAEKQRVKSESILKAQASLRKSVASLPLLFVERKATLRTFKKYSTFILNNAITMQRKDVKRWLKALKNKTSKERLKALATQIANSHLEFVFGVLPILDEIMDSVEHFSKPESLVRTGRGRMRFVTETVTKHGSRKHSIDDSMYTLEDRVRNDFSVRTNLRCDITSSVANNASLLGFNPLYAWYDMTPLSFIVGWFSNFNTWVQSLDPLVGLEYSSGSSSIQNEQTLERVALFDKMSRKDEDDKYTSTVYTHEGPIRSTSSVKLTSFNREVYEVMPGIQSLALMNKTSLFTHAASLSLTVQRLVSNANAEFKVKQFSYRGRKPRNLPPIRFK